MYSTSDRDGTSREEVATTSDFERLTMPHLADVARFARSLTRDEVRADDLVQDTYLQAMRGWHTFQPGSDPRRWLFTVCHHMFLRTIRREARYVAAPEDDPELDSAATAKAHWRAMDAGVADIVAEVTDDKSLPKAERKRLQIEHAAHISHGAQLVKLADKICNLRDIIAMPPSNWGEERKREYFEWAKRVVDGLRGAHAGLEAAFDEAYRKGVPSGRALS